MYTKLLLNVRRSVSFFHVNSLSCLFLVSRNTAEDMAVDISYQADQESRKSVTDSPKTSFLSSIGAHEIYSSEVSLIYLCSQDCSNQLVPDNFFCFP